MGSHVFARRATFKKQGCPDIRVEVYQNSGYGFSTRIDGQQGVMWPKYSARELMTGDTPPHTLDDAWRTILSKFADYTATAVEEAFPVLESR